MGLMRSSAPLFGCLVAVLIGFQAIHEWTGAAWARLPLMLCVAAIVVLLAAASQRTGKLFLGVCILATGALVLTQETLSEVLGRALVNIGFLASFFSALTILRVAADTSRAMNRAGTYLATRPPGRRYLSLTFGTQVFALLLNFGAIQLLGALSLASANQEPDEEIRRIRVRRMLLAIQRGFVSALPWSPMAFSTAMAVATIPGLSWAKLAVPGLVSSLILLAAGWAMDTIFKPRLKRSVPAAGAKDLRWPVLLPLAALLVLMLVPVLAVELLLGIRVVGAVLVVVPLLSIVWIWFQSVDLARFSERLVTYVVDEIPRYRRDLLLIMSAGYLGVVGAALLGPVMEHAGLDMTLLPSWLLLLGLIWVMPMFGQIGANPILSMSLLAPILPPAEALGVSPSAIAAALLCGWALTGLTSPFTATNLLVGRFGDISTSDVGWVWNRWHFLVSVTLLSIWVLVYAFCLA